MAASAGMELLYASGVGTIGVLIVQLTETFNVKKSALTWVGGLLLFSGFILGKSIMRISRINRKGWKGFLPVIPQYIVKCMYRLDM